MLKKIYDKAGPKKEVVESFKASLKKIKPEINLEKKRKQGFIARLGNCRLYDIAPKRSLKYSFVSTRHKEGLQQRRRAQNLDLEEERQRMQEYWARL